MKISVYFSNLDANTRPVTFKKRLLVHSLVTSLDDIREVVNSGDRTLSIFTTQHGDQPVAESTVYVEYSEFAFPTGCHLSPNGRLSCQRKNLKTIGEHKAYMNTSQSFVIIFQYYISI